MTRVERVRKGRGYVLLELSDEASIRLPMPLQKERRYREGQEFDRESYEKLLENREYAHALDDAVRLLSFRARSERELVRYLEGRGYREEAVARVMQRLSREGYLSDAVFADHYVQSKAMKAVGTRRLTQELRQKGVGEEIIEQSIAQIDEEEALRVAAQHAEKLLRRVRGRDARDTQQKVLQGLFRRGYDLSTAKEALRRAQEGELDDAFFEE